jgi:hypothetical protein
MKQDEVMKLALEALELVKWTNNLQVDEAITALKERLAQRTEQAPVGEVSWAANVPNTIREVHWVDGCPEIGTKLYTTQPAQPAQRTWVGLTDEDKCKPDLGKWVELNEDWLDGYQAGLEFANKKLKEKNT